MKLNNTVQEITAGVGAVTTTVAQTGIPDDIKHGLVSLIVGVISGLLMKLLNKIGNGNKEAKGEK